MLLSRGHCWVPAGIDFTRSCLYAQLLAILPTMRNSSISMFSTPARTLYICIAQASYDYMALDSLTGRVRVLG